MLAWVRNDVASTEMYWFGHGSSAANGQLQYGRLADDKISCSVNSSPVVTPSAYPATDGAWHLHVCTFAGSGGGNTRGVYYDAS